MLPAGRKAIPLDGGGSYARQAASRFAKRGLMAHLREVDPGPHLDWWHTGLIIEACQGVIDGDILRLLACAPPRYYKSRTITQGLPSCWMRTHPGTFVGLMVGDVRLARFHSQHARDMAQRAGVTLRVDSKDKSIWLTQDQHGGFWITTPTGGRLGFGFHLGVIDDPFTSYVAGGSTAKQNEVEGAFDDFVGRGEKGAMPFRVVVMHQRLNPRDLAGRLLAREADKQREHGWHVLNLPAESRPLRVQLPGSCKVIPDPRPPGVPLCEALEGLDQIRRRVADNPIRASAVDGQDPLEAAGGGVFRRSFFCTYGEELEDVSDPLTATAELVKRGSIPAVERWICGHDLGSGGPSSDPVASVLMAGFARGLHLKRFVAHAREHQPAPGTVSAYVLSIAGRYGKGVEHALPREGATGKAFVDELTADLRREGYVVHLISESGSKKVKARSYASAASPTCSRCGALIVAEADAAGLRPTDICRCDEPAGSGKGGVGLLVGEWNEHFVQTHHVFTGEGADEDDHEVDAARMAHMAHGGDIPERDWSLFG